MTRKDYKLIAEAIKHEVVFPRDLKQIEMVVKELSERLKRENPKFNQYIFERACGIINN